MLETSVAGSLSGIVGDFTFMKTQRTLAILWLASFISGLYYWLWEFLHKSAPAYDGIHALLSLPFLFGVVASIFLFRGAKWGRISIGILALFFGVVQLWDIWQKGWMWDKWADNGLLILSLASVVLLLFPGRRPAA